MMRRPRLIILETVKEIRRIMGEVRRSGEVIMEQSETDPSNFFKPTSKISKEDPAPQKPSHQIYLQSPEGDVLDLTASTRSFQIASGLPPSMPPTVFLRSSDEVMVDEFYDPEEPLPEGQETGSNFNVEQASRDIRDDYLYPDAEVPEEDRATEIIEDLIAGTDRPTLTMGDNRAVIESQASRAHGIPTAEFEAFIERRWRERGYTFDPRIRDLPDLTDAMELQTLRAERIIRDQVLNAFAVPAHYWMQSMRTMEQFGERITVVGEQLTDSFEGITEGIVQMVEVFRQTKEFSDMMETWELLAEGIELAGMSEREKAKKHCNPFPKTLTPPIDVGMAFVLTNQSLPLEHECTLGRIYPRAPPLI